MSTQHLNDCNTCESIKNGSVGDQSNYSSDYEDSSAKTDPLDKEVSINLDSLKLDFSESKSVKSRSSSRIPVPQNKTFSSEKIREIERGNAMLVDKILYHTTRPNQYVQSRVAAPKVTSSEINRRRRQDKINRENQILLKKIQAVKPAVRH